MTILGEVNMLYIGVWAVFVSGFLFSVWLLIGAQGDLMIDDTMNGENDDEMVSRTFLKLVAETQKSLVIHDDGGNSPNSVYNNDDVIEALRQRIQDCGIEVKCLFNEADEPIKLLDLAREFPSNVSIRYLDEGRPEHDIHYKIVDNGKLMYLSRHDRGQGDRKYVYRKANKWWMFAGTRRRISRDYMDLFNRGVKASSPAHLHAQSA